MLWASQNRDRKGAFFHRPAARYRDQPAKPLLSSIPDSHHMLFVVIERFKSGAVPIGQRFHATGRMLPEGVIYHASWVDSAGTQCFQIMEAPDRHALTPWIEHWSDLVDFEIIQVQTSAGFWSRTLPD